MFGAFCDGNITHVYCLRYCFMEILQKELNFVASSWNEHVIRASNMAECPSGIPDEMFFLPENSGGTDMLRVLSPAKVSWAKSLCRRPASLSGDTDFDAYAGYVMNSQGYSRPSTWQEALKLYFDIVRVAA